MVTKKGKSHRPSNLGEEYLNFHIYEGKNESYKNYSKAIETLRCIQSCATKISHNKLGHGGGFGSMFQYSAREFLDRHVEAKQKGLSTKFRFVGDFKWYTKNTPCLRKGYRCFFKREVSGASSAYRCRTECNFREVPLAFNIFWWRVFQAYMFRPNHLLMRGAEEVRKHFNFTSYPDIALHIRYGDKEKNKKSRQTMPISLTRYLDLAEFWSKKLVSLSQTKQVLIYVATDSLFARDRVKEWESMHNDTVLVIMQSSELSSNDRKEAAKAGLQLSELAKFEESRKFLVDLHFMMNAKYFAGLCMSQPARLAANIGFATGKMIQAVALDEQNIDLVDRWKLGSEEGWSRISDILPK